MRFPNSYGSITKLKGKRRKPYMVRVTASMEYDDTTQKYKQVQKVIGYFAKREEAIKCLADYNDNPYDLNALSVTFDECFQGAKKSFAEQQERAYTNAYRYFEPLYDVPIRQIKAGQLQNCINSCTNSQQPVIKTLAHKIYEYALTNEIVEKNPSQYLKAVTPETKIVRTLFDHDQVEELLKYSDFWWAKVTIILLYTGLRTKELKNIDLQNIDFDNRWMTLTAAKNECSVRGIPIHKAIEPYLRDYIKQGGNLYGYAHSTLNKALGEFHGHRAHD